MADNSGGAGILGVLVGVMLVIFVGAAVLMVTNGRIGNSGPSLTIRCLAQSNGHISRRKHPMHGLIYLVGLVVVILAVLSLLGLR